jgi:spermidine synthase
MKDHILILITVFVASLVSLGYEITLIRIFSVALSYHFAFMVISISMLGIGASGTLLSIFPVMKKWEYIPLYSLMLSVSIPASYLALNMIPFEPARFMWDKVQLLYISLYYIVLAVPFFSFGLIVASAFSTLRKYIGYIYGADLAGAGIGSIMILAFLTISGPDRIVFILSSLLIIPILLFRNKGIWLACALLLFLNLAALFLHPSFLHMRISPYKPLETALQYPGAEHLKTYHSPFSRIDLFNSPAVRFAPGLSFKYLENLPGQTGITEDAGHISAITEDTSRTELRFIEYLPSALPYKLARKADVLILDPKGGLSALTADYYHTSNIYMVESNPSIVRAIRNFSEGFSATVYDQHVWQGLGRSVLRSIGKTFDLIDISIMGSVPSSSFGFSEDYRFTVEAFEEYATYLKPDGFLAINLFILPPPRSELRLLNTITEAFENQNIQDIGNNIAAIRSWGTITIIAKKSALSRKDIMVIRDFARDKRFDLVYYPGITDSETNVYIKMPTREYADSFKFLLNKATQKHFSNDYVFNIEPVHDDNPFFHYFLKIRNIQKIYPLMGGKWQYFLEEGYLLPLILIQVVFLGMVLILLPSVTFTSIRTPVRHPHLFLSLSYFAFLGIAFMFIEISFIQRMILPLVNPSHATSAVLAAILISSGIGSLLSQFLPLFRNAKMLLVLAFTILVYSIFISNIISFMLPYTLIIKIMLVFIILLPAGIGMGIPFPMGLSLIGRKRPELIPWAWAVNGCFSVVAPIAAIMFAITAGFKLLMFTGVIMYVLAYLSLRAAGYRGS